MQSITKMAQEGAAPGSFLGAVFRIAFFVSVIAMAWSLQ